MLVVPLCSKRQNRITIVDDSEYANIKIKEKQMEYDSRGI